MVQYREAKRWHLAVALLTAGKRPPAPLSSARILLTRHSSVAPDFDNLVISAKAIVDGLVSAGILEHDRLSIERRYDWQQAPRRGGWLEVIVEEVVG